MLTTLAICLGFVSGNAGTLNCVGERLSEVSDTVVTIGSRRELFLDSLLVEKMSGEAQLRLHHPVPREVVIEHDEPWEGAGCGYHSVFQDGNTYRMYYKAWQRTIGPGFPDTDSNPLSCNYAESKDGIHWVKPKLKLHKFHGAKHNNIVIASGEFNGIKIDAGHPAVFKDDNPGVSPDARYKALLPTQWETVPKGLMAFKSPDGLHWSPLTDSLIITDGIFDSQNLAFWDGEKGVYRAYWRYFAGGHQGGVRAVRTATSKDFIHWYDQTDVAYFNAPSEQLYTSQIKPYHRAPHILIGFPLRYIDRGWSESMLTLPDSSHRNWRAAREKRLGTALTEGLIMSSRDGYRFTRWQEAFLRPGPEIPGSWSYGDQAIAWHVVETKSSIAGAPNELSIYAAEQYWTGKKGSTLRRYTLRLDGFVSVNAPMRGGELITKPFIFSGKELNINFSSSAVGDIRIEIQDISGNPYSGFSLSDCAPVFGDAVDRKIFWGKSGEVASLAGKVVRLRFVLKDADLYAFQFK